MSAWTKGTWLMFSWDDNGTPVVGVTAKGGGDVADCSMNNYRGIVELEANAHLIAQAPAMYEALEGLRDLCEKAGFPCDKANAVLAAARGDSHG